MKRVTAHLGFDSHDQAELGGLVEAAGKAWQGANVGGLLTVAGTPQFHVNLAAVDVIVVEDTDVPGTHVLKRRQPDGS